MAISVLVVDDTITYRRIVSEALGRIEGVEVVGTAHSGAAALAKMERLNPDLVTLDLEMPDLNGIQVLEEMRQRKSRAAPIMVSSFTERGGELTIKALEAGAFDFVTKTGAGSPEAQLQRLSADLSAIIQSWQNRRNRAAPPAGQAPPTSTAPARQTAPPAARPTPRSPTSASLAKRPEMILIGISTGGPNALATIMPAFPATLPVPIFIVQHMPRLFTGYLAESLSKKARVPIAEATDGAIARAGHVYLAPGGQHLKIARCAAGIRMRVTDDPPENNCRPSVDVLFRSAANEFPGKSCGVIMTGMGNDGALGSRLLKRKGSTILAQDEASCVVYGMPKEVVATGVVDQQLPLDQIPAAILGLFSLRPC
jgi:two-component system chemotaxis response regulator CheB